MMSRKAVQCAFRGHILVSQCLTKQMTAKVIEDEPDFKILMTELDRLYTQAKASCVNLDALLKTDCIKRISQALLQRNLNYRNIQKRANDRFGQCLLL